MIDTLKNPESNIIKTNRPEEFVNELSRRAHFDLKQRVQDLDFYRTRVFFTHTIIQRNRTLKIELGNKTYIVPAILNGIVNQIEESKEILSYPMDWDDDGAVATDKETFHHAARFVIEYSLSAYEEYGVVLTTPYIDIMRDGSVSVLWESEKAQMLIIFKLGDRDLAYYYAEQKDKQIPTKSAIDISESMDNILFSWMITYLK